MAKCPWEAVTMRTNHHNEDIMLNKSEDGVLSELNPFRKLFFVIICSDLRYYRFLWSKIPFVCPI